MDIDTQFLYLFATSSHIYMLFGHIGHVDKNLVKSEDVDRWFNQYVVSLSKTHYPHCFSQLG